MAAAAAAASTMARAPSSWKLAAQKPAVSHVINSIICIQTHMVDF